MAVFPLCRNVPGTLQMLKNICCVQKSYPMNVKVKKKSLLRQNGGTLLLKQLFCKRHPELYQKPIRNGRALEK